MTDFRVTVEGGDLRRAHQALAGFGKVKIGPIEDLGYTDAPGPRGEVAKLIVELDAANAEDAEAAVAKRLPAEGSKVANVERVERD